jgi:MFS family permease
MLRDVGMSYWAYTCVFLGSVVSGLVSFPVWGKHADIVGNARILKTTSLLLPVIPLLWLASRNVYYLVAVELFAGFVWGGFNLCATNFIYDAVSPAKRVRCLGYYNLFSGVAIFAGAGIGGVLADRLPPLFGYPLLSLFVLSAALRGLARLFLSPHFREVRTAARHVSSAELFFSVVGMRPLAGLNREWNVFPSLRRPDGP